MEQFSLLEMLDSITEEEVQFFIDNRLSSNGQENFKKMPLEKQRMLVLLDRLPASELDSLKSKAKSNGQLVGLHDINNLLAALYLFRKEKN